MSERSKEYLREYRKVKRVELAAYHARDDVRSKKNEQKREWHRRNPARSKAITARSRLKYRYGISPEFVAELRQKQDDCCAVCCTSDWGGRYGTPNIDHCHETGRVRGLLCKECNVLLGRLGDQPASVREWMSRFLSYLGQGL